MVLGATQTLSGDLINPIRCLDPGITFLHLGLTLLYTIISIIFG
ncbi:MAG: hypothetical protein [Olavius algarvensis Delta 4 endosymbiont]|nr:MAG: hypothetical protein [Olavius algarvensis Delta 4 endosymbiont]